MCGGIYLSSMWANTCWGFLSLAVAFALARLSMIWVIGHEEWGPRLSYASAICLVLSVTCFLLYFVFGRRKLNPQVRPDMSISDVTNYMVNDSSVVLKKPKPSEIAQFGPAKGRLVNWPGIGHVDALARVQTALNNGTLEAWGQREIKPNSASFEASLRPIPKTYWESACMNQLFCFYKNSAHPQTMELTGKSVELYANLTLNKKQVISHWARAPLWRKILSDLRIIHRKNYFGKPLDKHYIPIH